MRQQGTAVPICKGVSQSSKKSLNSPAQVTASSKPDGTCATESWTIRLQAGNWKELLIIVKTLLIRNNMKNISYWKSELHLYVINTEVGSFTVCNRSYLPKSISPLSSFKCFMYKTQLGDLCNTNQTDALSFLIYVNNYPLHVLNRLTIHHPEAVPPWLC